MMQWQVPLPGDMRHLIDVMDAEKGAKHL
jgi:hypothetical protein